MSHPFDETHARIRQIVANSQRLTGHDVLVEFGAFVESKNIQIFTLINGLTYQLTLPKGNAANNAAQFVFRNLEKRLRAAVYQLLEEASDQPESKLVKTMRTRHEARMALIKRCLEVIADIRRERRDITQREVAKRLYRGVLNTTDEKDEARFSQELRRKRISFMKIVEMKKRWTELTREEKIDLSCLEPRR